MIEITYDRKERIYKWTDPESGEILTAPSKRRAELFRAAVGMLDPDLYASASRIIEKHPQLERVTWRAVELVVNDAVEVFPAPRGNVMAMVESSDDYGRYAITYDDGYQVCQCPHFQNMAAPMTDQGNRYCKHLVAVYLWQVTREDRF